MLHVFKFRRRFNVGAFLRWRMFSALLPTSDDHFAFPCDHWAVVASAAGQKLPRTAEQVADPLVNSARDCVLLPRRSLQTLHKCATLEIGENFVELVRDLLKLSEQVLLLLHRFINRLGRGLR